MLCGPGSSVSIATDYGLDGLGIFIPVGARFFVHIQTGPGADPASCTMGHANKARRWSFCAVTLPTVGTVTAQRLLRLGVVLYALRGLGWLSHYSYSLRAG